MASISNRSSNGRKKCFTLKTAKTFVVNASKPDVAAELPMRWEDNENDPNVQLSHEEVLEGTVREAFDDDDEDFPEGGDGETAGPRTGL